MKDSFKISVGKRLRLTANCLGFATTSDFARYLGSERGRVDAWFNGQTLPPVQMMAGFVKAFGLTLDWIYLGELGGLTYDRAIVFQEMINKKSVSNNLIICCSDLRSDGENSDLEGMALDTLSDNTKVIK